MLWMSGFFGALGEQSRRTIDLWVVYKLSDGSPIQLGVVGLAQAAPILLMGWFGGVLADLVDRRKLLMMGQAARIVLALLIAGLAIAEVLQVWHVYAITFGMGLAQSLEQPARVSLIPGIVPRSHLLNAMTLQQAMRQGSMLTGPPAAGIIIGIAGEGPPTWHTPHSTARRSSCCCSSRAVRERTWADCGRSGWGRPSTASDSS